MPRKNPQFAQLRARMAFLGYSGKTLAEEIGMNKQNVCRRLGCKASWTLAEVYRVCETLEIPLSEIAAYFPFGDVKEAER